MTRGPIGDLLAAGVLAVAVFCAGRLVLAVARRSVGARAVDVTHTMMGVSMGGMLTGWITASGNEVWTIAFVVATIWFGWSVVRQLSPGPAPAPTAGHLQHFVACAAMLYMLLAMGASAMGTSGMHAMAGATASPALPVALALLLVANAIFAGGKCVMSAPRVDRVIAQLATAGGLPPAPFTADPRDGGAGETGRDVGGRGRWAGPPVPAVLYPAAPVQVVWASSLPSRTRRELAPRLTSVCLVVMSLAMAYMFITVRP